MNTNLKKDSAYSYKQIISSEKYKKNKDALTAILDENKSYTTEEIEQILADFMKEGAY